MAKRFGGEPLVEIDNRSIAQHKDREEYLEHRVMVLEERIKTLERLSVIITPGVPQNDPRMPQDSKENNK